MRGKRPINADVPENQPGTEDEQVSSQKPSTPAAKPDPTEAKEPKPKADPPASKPEPQKPKAPQPRQPRRPIPLALRLIAATVVLAVVFIVAAILGGRDSEQGEVKPGGSAPVTGREPSRAPSESAAELGYPAFATKNTTRVGGADSVANAAGVALATFPSTNPQLSPAAVTLVAEDDWQGAIAAAVLMAEPVRAPLLFSAHDGLPDTTAQALDALDPQGNKDTRGTREFAIGDVATSASTEETRRVKAGDAASTAAAIARLRDKLVGSAPAHVVVASGEDPGFAMPAAAWAARSGDPVLFTARDALPAATVAALRRHRKLPVFVLGPPAAISAKVIEQISQIGPKVRRVSGKDPVSNAIALARYAEGSFGWNVNDPGHGFVIARSDSPLDAAAAAPLSASGTWGPLLLTDSADTLPAALREYLLDVKPGYTTDPTRAFYNHVWVIGDQEAIDVSQQAEIDNLAELAKIGAQP